MLEPGWEADAVGIQVGEAGWVHRSTGSLLGPSQIEPGLEASLPPPGETWEVVGPDRSLPQGGTFPPSVPGGVVPALPQVQGWPRPWVSVVYRSAPEATHGSDMGFIPPWSWRLESGIQAGGPSWASLWGMWTAVSPHVLQGRPSECVCVLTSFYKDPSPVGFTPTSDLIIYPNHPIKRV